MSGDVGTPILFEHMSSTCTTVLEVVYMVLLHTRHHCLFPSPVFRLYRPGPPLAGGRSPRRGERGGAERWRRNLSRERTIGGGTVAHGGRRSDSRRKPTDEREHLRTILRGLICTRAGASN
jgi:hypothetical protein